MRQALNALPGNLRNRKTLILIAAIFTIAVVGCRGGGASPSASDQVIPVIPPTVPEAACINTTQPDDAPHFADLDFSLLQASIDGLRFYDVVPGIGISPDVADAVTVEYTGWFEDGCMFDTSYTNPNDVTFPLINVIPGWREGIAAMQIGGTRVIEISPELAYGEIGFPPTIPPNTTLIFHVILISRITIAEAQATLEVTRAAATVQAGVAAATAAAANCINDSQPAGAPTFDEIDTSRFALLAPGLRFYEIEHGTGDIPDVTDTVSVEYTGWLDNGCMFDTSYTDEGPITFPLTGVIRGWQDSLATMEVGGTWVVEISPDLGYGEFGFPPTIPGNATLIFHINLISKE